VPKVKFLFLDVKVNCLWADFYCWSQRLWSDKL